MTTELNYVLTASELVAHGIGTNRIRLFRKYFRESTELTSKTIQKFMDLSLFSIITVLMQQNEVMAKTMVKHRKYFLKDSYPAYVYARYVEGPHDETRTIACRAPYEAFWYAKHVDKKSGPDTYKAACKNQHAKTVYENWIEEKSKENK